MWRSLITVSCIYALFLDAFCLLRFFSYKKRYKGKTNGLVIKTYSGRQDTGDMIFKYQVDIKYTIDREYYVSSCNCSGGLGRNKRVAILYNLDDPGDIIPQANLETLTFRVVTALAYVFVMFFVQ